MHVALLLAATVQCMLLECGLEVVQLRLQRMKGRFVLATLLAPLMGFVRHGQTTCNFRTPRMQEIRVLFHVLVGNDRD
jgi:hypothetical protein